MLTIFTARCPRLASNLGHRAFLFLPRRVPSPTRVVAPIDCVSSHITRKCSALPRQTECVRAGEMAIGMSEAAFRDYLVTVLREPERVFSALPRSADGRWRHVCAGLGRLRLFSRCGSFRWFGSPARRGVVVG